MARQIDYYFSIQSPWAYIGHALFQDLAAAHQLKVNYKPVVLVDLFSETGGLPLAKKSCCQRTPSFFWPAAPYRLVTCQSQAHAKST